MRSLLLTPDPVTYLGPTLSPNTQKTGYLRKGTHAELKNLVTYWNILCALSLFPPSTFSI